MGALGRAARTADLPLAERYLRWGVSVDAPIGGSCALLIAMREGRWDMAAALVTRHGARVSCRERETGDGPLHIVAEAGAPSVTVEV